MNDAFDDLERDLRRTVRSRRRRRLGRTPALALVAALALGGGGAVAATRLARDPGIEREAERIVLETFKETRDLPACRPAASDPAVADLPLSPAIAATLPALATPVEGVDPAPIIGRLHGGTAGTVLRPSVRTLHLAGGVTLDVFVVENARRQDRDAPACVAARLEQARALASGEVLAAAERRLAARPPAPSGQQTVFVFTTVPGVGGSSGAGFVAPPGKRLPAGIVASGSAPGGARRYTGIAGPGVARIRVEPERGRGKTAVVHQGFYSFALARGLGPVRLRELDAAGATLRTRRLR